MKNLQIFFNALFLNPILEKLGFSFGKKVLENKILVPPKSLVDVDLRGEGIVSLYPLLKKVNTEQIKNFLKEKKSFLLGENADALLIEARALVYLQGKMILSLGEDNSLCVFKPENNFFSNRIDLSFVEQKEEFLMCKEEKFVLVYRKIKPKSLNDVDLPWEGGVYDPH